MIDQLADDKMQLQIRDRLLGAALDETARLGKISGQYAATKIPPLENPLEYMPNTGGRNTEQIFQMRRVVNHHRIDMIVKPCPHAGEIVHHRNAVRRKLCSRPDAGQHKQLRRLQRARAQQHFARRFQSMQCAAATIFDADCAPAFHQYPRGLCAGDDL